MEKTSSTEQSKIINIVQAVENYYQLAGWTTMIVKNDTNNNILLTDFFAKKDCFRTDKSGAKKPHGTKMHFVCVIAQENAANSKYDGLMKNSFIQNAFSNGAEPIFAMVTTKTTKDDSKPNYHISLKNANTSIIVRLISRVNKPAEISNSKNKSTDSKNKSTDLKNKSTN